MTQFSYDRYYAEIEVEAARIAELARGADPATPVPTCPGWTLAKLVTHLGRAHRWALAAVAGRATEYVDPRGVGDGIPPGDSEGRLAWLTSGAERMVRALREAGPEAPVWSWGYAQTAGFWTRRMAHETLVHRADACLAVGAEFAPAPESAADGLSELLDLIASPRAAEIQPGFAKLAGDGQTLHFHATDDGLGAAGEWLVRRTPGGVVWKYGHDKGDVAVRGTAAGLLLMAYRRLTPAEAGVEVLGDERLLGHWLDHSAL
jgi:uncharacterized protein (TIGR03083 family)